MLHHSDVDFEHFRVSPSQAMSPRMRPQTPGFVEGLQPAPGSNYMQEDWPPPPEEADYHLGPSAEQQHRQTQQMGTTAAPGSPASVEKFSLDKKSPPASPVFTVHSRPAGALHPSSPPHRSRKFSSRSGHHEYIFLGRELWSTHTRSWNVLNKYSHSVVVVVRCVEGGSGPVLCEGGTSPQYAIIRSGGREGSSRQGVRIPRHIVRCDEGCGEDKGCGPPAAKSANILLPWQWSPRVLIPKPCSRPRNLSEMFESNVANMVSPGTLSRSTTPLTGGHVPSPRPSRTMSEITTGSQLEFADPDQTIIIWDWDGRGRGHVGTTSWAVFTVLTEKMISVPHFRT